jgi:hypothetical protein
METHVPMKRLLGVVSGDSQIFTLEEVNHLKECTECFEAWSDSIDQLVRDGTSIKEAVKDSFRLHVVSGHSHSITTGQNSEKRGSLRRPISAGVGKESNFSMDASRPEYS